VTGVTITRRHLPAPPEPAHQRAPIDPKVEARRHADVLKLVGYFAGRAGQWRTIAQVVIGTRLPIGRAYEALDQLVADGFLVKENEHVTGAGSVTPAWIRRDPPPAGGVDG
jgi:hypothetical protein